jgi:hypothetical protein
MNIRTIRQKEVVDVTVLFNKIFNESFDYYPKNQSKKTLNLWTEEKNIKKTSKPKL